MHAGGALLYWPNDLPPIPSRAARSGVGRVDPQDAGQYLLLMQTRLSPFAKNCVDELRAGDAAGNGDCVEHIDGFARAGASQVNIITTNGHDFVHGLLQRLRVDAAGCCLCLREGAP